MQSQAITIASIKGGVGKSTSSIVVADILARDWKTLLIDLDTRPAQPATTVTPKGNRTTISMKS